MTIGTFIDAVAEEVAYRGWRLIDGFKREDILFIFDWYKTDNQNPAECAKGLGYHWQEGH